MLSPPSGSGHLDAGREHLLAEDAHTPPPYSRSTFYVNDPSKARPTPTWLHSATLIRESVLAGISVTGTYLSEVPQSFLRIGYVLETRGPGWGVRPSPGC